MAVYWPLQPPTVSSGYCIGRTLEYGVVVDAVAPTTESIPADCVGTFNHSSHSKPRLPLTIVQAPGSPRPSLVHLNSKPATLCLYENERHLEIALRGDDQIEGCDFEPVSVGTSYFHTHIMLCLKPQGYKLLCVDIVCGIMLLKLGVATHVARLLDEYGFAVTKYAESLIDHLMGAPADFKLNNAATSFYGSILLYVFAALQSARITLLPLSHLETLLEIMLCTGAVATAAGCVDLMRLFASPLLWVQRANARMWQITSLLKTLFSLLFRSKKYNIIRKRFDSVDTTYMQSALCAYLFAICVFLFPTILVTRETSEPTIVDLRVDEKLDWESILKSWFRYSVPIQDW
eukprot:GEMP01063325.1.p1 GENE.GEMP01063325.1~~GEMP01063325.1.p1  ORF type:complete len:347 (+),score=33.13 GEMP01063325.1:40-1080(+)